MMNIQRALPATIFALYLVIFVALALPLSSVSRTNSKEGRESEQERENERYRAWKKNHEHEGHHESMDFKTWKKFDACPANPNVKICFNKTCCANKIVVDCLIDKWRPNAEKFAICKSAIHCVRRRMKNEVKQKCLSQKRLSNFLGASIPYCIPLCEKLNNPKFAENLPIPSGKHLVTTKPKYFSST